MGEMGGGGPVNSLRRVDALPTTWSTYWQDWRAWQAAGPDTGRAFAELLTLCHLQGHLYIQTKGNMDQERVVLSGMVGD